MIVSATYWVWRDQFTVLEADPSSPHWWPVLSSVGAVPGSFIVTAVLGTVTTIITGDAVERHLGTRTWVAAAASGQVVDVAATWLTLPLFTRVLSTWGQTIDAGSLQGTSLILVALVGAIAQSLASHWRWRARFLLIGILILSATILGSAISYAHVQSLLAGMIAAHLAGIRGVRSGPGNDVTIGR